MRPARTTTLLVALVVSLAVALAACGGSDGSSDTTAPGVTTGPVVSEVPTSAPPDTEPPVTEPPVAEPPATEPPATEPPATEPPVISPLPDVEPLAVLEVTDGDRPRFTWEEIDGAAEYSIVVADADGGVIWAWRGKATSIDLGAGLIEGNEGPRLAPRSTLDVFALAADGEILAASGPVPVSP